MEQRKSFNSRPTDIQARNILVITGDPLSEKLAGPAIRAANFASQLTEDGHRVRLATLQSASIQFPGFEVVAVSTQDEMKEQEAWSEIIIVQGNALVLFPSLENTRKYLVVDVYDPMHLEQLEQGRGLRQADWNNAILGANAILNHQLRIGDFFIAASDRQLHFWLGALASLGRINSRTYTQDLSLRSLIDVVPFGLDQDLPEARTPALRNVIPGIDAQSKILIWAGGIYNWFDPESLVRAVGILAPKHPEIRLFFMGTRHPHPGVPEMEVVRRTRELSESLNLTDKHVFFNDSWVDYDLRHNFLLEADAGVSTHYEHIETVFSFRTRILDYLWAGLPIITTKGDSFAELVELHGLGAVVNEMDAESLATAIEQVLFDPAVAARARAAVSSVRDTFTWQNTTEPLRRYCADPHHAADRVDETTTGTIRRPVLHRGGRFTLFNFKRAWGVLTSQGPAALARKIRRPGR